MAEVARPGGMVAVTNPHNPTGTAVEPEALRRFVAAVPEDCLIVLDEAYHEFVEDGLRCTGVDLVPDRPNVVVLRTFSKAHGIAGLRVGCAIASPALLEPVERIRPPFNVSLLAQVAALAALEDRDHLERTVASNAAARRLFLDACAPARPGGHPVPGELRARGEPRRPWSRRLAGGIGRGRHLGPARREPGNARMAPRLPGDAWDYMARVVQVMEGALSG